MGFHSGASLATALLAAWTGEVVANKQPEGGDTAKYQGEGGPCELAFLELDFTRHVQMGPGGSSRA